MRCEYCKKEGIKKESIYNLCEEHYNQIQKDKKVKPTKTFTFNFV